MDTTLVAKVNGWTIEGSRMELILAVLEKDATTELDRLANSPLGLMGHLVRITITDLGPAHEQR